jgi:hypothetical protein
MQTHYDVLGVRHDADLDEIKRSWRVKVQLLHPDRHHGASADVQVQAAKETLLLTEAWEVLRDPERRRAYDMRLAEAETGRGRTVGTEQHSNHESREDPHLLVCLRCHASQQVPVDATRGECRACLSPWRLVVCDGCGMRVQADEGWAKWRCLSCGRRHQSYWGGTVSRACVRCSWSNDVPANSERFVCAKCDLEYLRCSCGEYTTVRSARWPRWRCASCNSYNTRLRRESSLEC